MDIVAVIDKSGSIRGETLSLVKQALHFIIDHCKSLAAGCAQNHLLAMQLDLDLAMDIIATKLACYLIGPSYL